MANSVAELFSIESGRAGAIPQAEYAAPIEAAPRSSQMPSMKYGLMKGIAYGASLGIKPVRKKYEQVMKDVTKHSPITRMESPDERKARTQQESAQAMQQKYMQMFGPEAGSRASAYEQLVNKYAGGG